MSMCVWCCSRSHPQSGSSRHAGPGSDAPGGRQLHLLQRPVEVPLPARVHQDEDLQWRQRERVQSPHDVPAVRLQHRWVVLSRRVGYYAIEDSGTVWHPLLHHQDSVVSYERRWFGGQIHIYELSLGLHKKNLICLIYHWNFKRALQVSLEEIVFHTTS